MRPRHRVAGHIGRSGRVSAIRHLLQACDYGKKADSVQLLLFAAKALWNAAAPLMSDELNADEARTAVKVALSMIPASCRSASMALVTRMCMGLLWSLRSNRRWDELSRTAEAALLVTPKILHAVLMKLQILALTHAEAPELFRTVRNIARGETSNEAVLLLFFARLSLNKPAMALEAYEGALDLFQADGDPQGINIHLELAEGLLSMRRPWARAWAHARAAIELAKSIEGRQEVSYRLGTSHLSPLPTCIQLQPFVTLRLCTSSDHIYYCD